jgi:hypothetical protein
VPYKLKVMPISCRIKRHHIDFDYEDTKIRAIRSKVGADGALILDQNNTIHKVNLNEKLSWLTFS